jgi:hypothetical protein
MKKSEINLDKLSLTSSATLWPVSPAILSPKTIRDPLIKPFKSYPLNGNSFNFLIIISFCGSGIRLSIKQAKQSIWILAIDAEKLRLLI